MAAIETDTFLRHPPARIWQALTERDLLGQWLMPNDFEARIGHKFTFQAEPMPQSGFDGIVRCEVLDLEPEQLLRISWQGGPGLDTTVTWKLAVEGRGTRLFLIHDGFDPADPAQKAVMDILGGGWSGHLAGRLRELLDQTADPRRA